MKTVLSTLLLSLIASVSYAAEKPQLEQYYIDNHCVGHIDLITEYNTRVDCLTDTTAYEYDFARKWAEAIGQSLHYGIATNSQSGIVIIVDDRNDKDQKYLKRLYDTIKLNDLDIIVEEIYTNNYPYRQK